MSVRLAADDALALHTQTSTTPAHTVSLVILGASEQLSHERLGQLVASSLPGMARFRSRLVGMPLGVGQPVWAEIDAYDPTRQIHSATVSAPGGDRELADLVTELTGGRQDWRRALWEAWTIDGLSAGRWALAVKMSPVLDSAPMWDCLLTAGPNSADDAPTEAGPGPVPSLGGLVTDTLTQLVENQVTGAYLVADAVTGVLGAIRHRLRVATDPRVDTRAASSMSGPVPKMVFSAPLTRRRSMGFASIPAADVKAVSDAFGGNTANVLLAACTLSLRNWLHRYDVVPDEPLLMEVPLSVPTGDPADDRYSVAVGQVRVPVQLDDPVQILSNLHTATERLNIANRLCGEKIDPTIDLAAVIALIPPSVARAAMYLYSGLGVGRWRAPHCHATLSFVAAREEWDYGAGIAVLGMYASEPLVEGRGLNITVNSHADAMCVCVSACPDNVPDVSDIALGIAQAVDVLVAAAVKSPRGQGRSVVTEMTSHNINRPLT